MKDEHNSVFYLLVPLGSSNCSGGTSTQDNSAEFAGTMNSTAAAVVVVEWQWNQIQEAGTDWPENNNK